MSSPAIKRDGDPALALPDFSDEELQRVAAGAHANPHGILGAHPVTVHGSGDHITVIRTLRPLAQKVVAIMTNGGRLELMHLAHGIWQGLSALEIGPYTIESRYDDGSTWSADDPYRHLPRIGELDLHLVGEGRHERLWDALGAHLHPATDQSPAGCSFTVWAPNAQAVRVVGDFNGWNGVGHAMRTMGATGVWELFVPSLNAGSNYKFEILSPDGHWLTRADPMARYTEVPPATASIVGASDYRWGDDAWMTARAETDPHNSPMSVYEVHLGSWRPGLNYRESADQLIEYVQELGFTHIEFMPLAEHPFGGSWGYQITSYYAATSRFGHPDDLKYLIDRLHQAGIGVLMDWVPGHFPKDEWALARFDGRAVYEHPDPRRGEQLDWGTLVFDFGRPEVRNFLVANALFWLEEFHVDGLRVDAVASMLYLDYSREEGQWAPNKYGGRENLEAIDFLQEVTATSYRRNPGIVMIAEESTSWGGVTAATSAGGLGFGMKWNMGWMHDSLRYMQVDPIYRSHHHSELTFSFLYAFSENFMLPISHDEVVHGKGSLARKMPGDRWQQLANVRAYLAFMWGHPGKQLLFMGQEFAQLSEWNEQHGLDWWILDQPAHRGVFELVAALNRLYREHPALWEQDNTPAGFQWIDGDAAADSVLSFLRWDSQGRPIAVIVNFSGTPHHDYRVGLPQSGRWRELLNTDAPQFGGSGVGNFGGVVAEENGWNGLPASAVLSLPPLGALWLSPSADD